MNLKEAKNYDLPLEIFIERYEDEDEDEENLSYENLRKEYIEYHLEVNGIIGNNKVDFFNILLNKNKFSFDDILEICKDTLHLIEEDFEVKRNENKLNFRREEFLFN